MEVVLNRMAQQTELTKTAVVWLGVWEFNPRAIRFYTRHGFKKVGDHKFVLGNDAQNDWLMAKLINFNN